MAYKRKPYTTNTPIPMKTNSSGILTTITLPDGLTKQTVYSASTSASDIIMDSTAASDINLETYYLEEITDTLERSRGLINGGIKISLKLPKALSGAKFEFERKAQKEERKITRRIYKLNK